MKNMKEAFEKAKRITFRLKDLLTVITDKSTLIRIFYKDSEIDYNKGAEYKDKYVISISIGTEDDQPCFNIYLDDSVEVIYMPNI